MKKKQHWHGVEEHFLVENGNKFVTLVFFLLLFPSGAFLPVSISLRLNFGSTTVFLGSSNNLCGQEALPFLHIALMENHKIKHEKKNQCAKTAKKSTRKKSATIPKIVYSSRE